MRPVAKAVAATIVSESRRLASANGAVAVKADDDDDDGDREDDDDDDNAFAVGRHCVQEDDGAT